METSSTGQAIGVVHAVITVHDMAEALRLYRDLLGLTVRVDIEHDPEPIGRLSGYENPDVRAVILDLPNGTELELAEFRRPSGRSRVEHDWPDVGINSVTFAVSGLDQLVTRITQAGYSFRGEVVTYGMEEGHTVRVVYCNGPDDVILTFTEEQLDPKHPGPE